MHRLAAVLVDQVFADPGFSLQVSVSRTALRHARCRIVSPPGHAEEGWGKGFARRVTRPYVHVEGGVV
eukprot:3667276-Pyramimonas_sp.AAC.1